MIRKKTCLKCAKNTNLRYNRYVRGEIMENDKIVIKGARENNLKNIDI